MATAILSSRNSLTLIHRNPNSCPKNRHKTTAPRQRKRTVVVCPATKTTNLVMGKVKILPRGESLSEFQNKIDSRRMMNDVDLVLASLGPDPEKQIGALILVGDYAGACSSVSPPPSSVPFPCFLEKK